MNNNLNSIKAANKNEKYREVSLDVGGYDRFYKNPLTKTFQYEYALYKAVSDLFGTVRCNSLCMESLKLYFSELGHKKEAEDKAAAEEAGSNAKSGKTQEGLVEEMKYLVSRDVVGHITFPQMNICAAQVKTIEEADGTHSFIFSDGIYGFKLSLEMKGKGKPARIRVFNMRRPVRTGSEKKDHENAALSGAA